MGTLRTPGGYVNPEWQELARRLTEGDGINWRGDPDLCLALGVITQGNQPIGHRLEVWRYTQNGESVLLGHWHPSESWRIPYDLCQMDPRSPGHVPVADRLDKSDAEMEKAADTAQHEVAMQAMEHAAWTHVRKHTGRTKHGQVGGLFPDAPAATPSVEGVR